MSAFGARPRGARLERLRASPQFRDGRFHNATPVGAAPVVGTTCRAGWGTLLREFATNARRQRPPAPLPTRDPRAAWHRPPETGLRATWLGHSTALLEIDGARILTDPVWSQRVSPLSWIGPRRFQPVPVSLDDLGPLDAVLISHDHYDHLDVATIAGLRGRDVTFYTSLGVGAHLEAWGVPAARIVELDWWESARLPHRDLQITAAPSQHFSGRSAQSRDRTLWSSFALAGPRHRVFFSGDTGLTRAYETIARRLGPFDLVLLEVGAYHPAWGDIHLGPDKALTALSMLGGGPLLPVHWGTFRLAVHAWDDPIETLLRAAIERDASLLVPRLGQPVEPARTGTVEPWWRALGRPSGVLHPRP